MFDFYVYVDPDTRDVKGMYLFGGLGPLVRLDGDWEPVNRETDPNMEDFASGYVTYNVDFNKGFEGGDDFDEEADEDGPGHPLVEAFDNGTITEVLVQQYGNLVSDETGSNPELNFD